MNDYSTKFFDQDGEEVGNMPGILNISLFKGMEISIHGNDTPFKVVTWSFIHDHEGGLRIHLENTEN